MRGDADPEAVQGEVSRRVLGSFRGRRPAVSASCRGAAGAGGRGDGVQCAHDHPHASISDAARRSSSAAASAQPAVGLGHPDDLADHQHGGVAAAGGCGGDGAQLGDGGALAGAVAAFDDGHGHVGAHAGPAQAGRQLVQGADAHQDHDGPAQAGQVRELLLGQRGVAGDHGEHVADFAVRDRDAGGGRNRDGAGDSGDDADRNPGSDAGSNFLAAAAEDVGVPALEADHVVAGQRAFDHELFDVGLADLVVAGLLAHVHQLRRGQGRQLLVRGEPVVEDDVGVAQRRHGGDGQQFGGARAAADQRDVARGAGRRLGGHRDAGCAAPVQEGVPAGLAVVDRGHQERALGQRAVMAGAAAGC